MGWSRYFGAVFLHGVLISRMGLCAESWPHEPTPCNGAIPSSDGCLVKISSTTPQQEQNLLAQKMSMLEAFLKSESVERARKLTGTKAANMANQAGELLQRAREKSARGEWEQVAQDLDNAIKLASAASAAAAQKNKPDLWREEKRYVRLRGQIESYLATVQGVLSERVAEERFSTARTEIDALLSKAAGLAKQKAYGLANNELSKAYEMSVILVSDLRSGTILVSSLNFATPSEEFEYERKRNHSYQMLVSMVMAERREVPESLSSLAANYLSESKNLLQQAEQQAEAGDYGKAIGTMEAATSRLIKILQASGIAVPQ